MNKSPNPEHVLFLKLHLNRSFSDETEHSLEAGQLYMEFVEENLEMMSLDTHEDNIENLLQLQTSAKWRSGMQSDGMKILECIAVMRKDILSFSKEVFDFLNYHKKSKCATLTPLQILDSSTTYCWVQLAFKQLPDSQYYFLRCLKELGGHDLLLEYLSCSSTEIPDLPKGSRLIDTNVEGADLKLFDPSSIFLGNDAYESMNAVLTKYCMNRDYKNTACLDEWWAENIPSRSVVFLAAIIRQITLPNSTVRSDSSLRQKILDWCMKNMREDVQNKLKTTCCYTARNLLTVFITEYEHSDDRERALKSSGGLLQTSSETSEEGVQGGSIEVKMLLYQLTVHLIAIVTAHPTCYLSTMFTNPAALQTCMIPTMPNNEMMSVASGMGNVAW
jgi:hypothetical protein